MCSNIDVQIKQINNVLGIEQNRDPCLAQDVPGGGSCSVLCRRLNIATHWLPWISFCFAQHPKFVFRVQQGVWSRMAE